MLTTSLFSLSSVLLVSAISLIGIFTLSLKDSVIKGVTFILVGIATGALLGDAFIHLIPEAFAETTNPTVLSLTIIGGMLIFFVLEKFLHWHHHQGLEESEPAVHPVGKMILVSDGVHNFVDGLIITASYLVSVEVGIATTIAVILHEIPQEIGDFGVLLHAGYTKAKALFYNFVSALFAFLGAGVALLLGGATELFTAWLVPLAAGGFIYIALTDLIPELHKTKSLRHSALQLLAVIVGIAAMVGLLAIETEDHGHGAEEAGVHESVEHE
ncbi:MAG: ZIP family metal transporter [Patescibacteria group bacterium]